MINSDSNLISRNTSIKRIYKLNKLSIHTNALNPMKFISLRNFEIEIVAMTAKIMNGDPHKCVGSVTSGGSESLLLAIKTYRDRLFHLNPDVKEPELIMCFSGHPAINKGIILKIKK